MTSKGAVVGTAIVVVALGVLLYLNRDTGTQSVIVVEDDTIAVDSKNRTGETGVSATPLSRPSPDVKPNRAPGLFRGDIGACFKHSGHGNSTVSVLATGNWHFTDNRVCGDGAPTAALREYRLNSPQCALKRYTGEEVRQCLGNKSILVVGDSVVRYQAMNMVVFLESLLPAKPCGTANQDNRAFHRNGPYFFCAGNVRCDCMTKGYVKDNFYYFSPELGINVTYLGYQESMFARNPIGWWPPSVEYVETPKAWAFQYLPDVVPIVKEKLGMFDLIIMNAGLWITPRFLVDVETAKNELIVLEGLLKPGAPKPVWMTTTVAFLDHADKEIGTVAAQELGWPILDRKGMNQNLIDRLHTLDVELRQGGYVDNMHFTGFPYQEMNNALYNLLCGN
jgi:hypothetical protein